MVEAARFKTDGRCQAVVAVGCMIERHKAGAARSRSPKSISSSAHPRCSGSFAGAGGAGTARRRSESTSCIPACASTPAIFRTFGTEDQRRLRSRLRVLRDSADARQASLVRARRSRSRSTAARDAGRARDQSRRAGSRALRTRPARWSQASGAARSACCARRRFRGSGCSTCIPPESRPPARSRRAREHAFSRISTCRCSTASDPVLARMRRPERKRTIRERVAEVPRRSSRCRDPHDVHRRISG